MTSVAIIAKASSTSSGAQSQSTSLAFFFMAKYVLCLAEFGLMAAAGQKKKSRGSATYLLLRWRLEDGLVRARGHGARAERLVVAAERAQRGGAHATGVALSATGRQGCWGRFATDPRTGRGGQSAV